MKPFRITKATPMDMKATFTIISFDINLRANKLTPEIKVMSVVQIQAKLNFTFTWQEDEKNTTQDSNKKRQEAEAIIRIYVSVASRIA